MQSNQTSKRIYRNSSRSKCCSSSSSNSSRWCRNWCKSTCSRAWCFSSNKLRIRSPRNNSQQQRPAHLSPSTISTSCKWCETNRIIHSTLTCHNKWFRTGHPTRANSTGTWTAVASARCSRPPCRLETPSHRAWECSLRWCSSSSSSSSSSRLLRTPSLTFEHF